MNIFKICKKELSDHISNKNFLIIYILVLLLTVSTFLWEARSYQHSQLINLADLASRNGVLEVRGLYSQTLFFLSVDLINSISPLYALTAIVISFYSINGEIDIGTLKVTMSYPVYRDEILLGKILGGFITILLVAFSSILIGFAILIPYTSIPFSIDLIFRIFIIVSAISLFSMLFFCIGLIFSVLFNSALKSFLFSLTVWIVIIKIYEYMTVSLGFLSGQIHFNAGYPNDSELINFYNRISVTNIKSQLGNILTETLKLVEIRGVTDYNNVYHMTINTIPIEVTISSIVTPFSILFVFTAFFIVLCYLAFRRKEMT